MNLLAVGIGRRDPWPTIYIEKRRRDSVRGLTIFVSFIVLVAVVIISYSHSLALFEMGGFTGWFRHLGVIVVEATFVLGFLNIVIARFQGRSPGKPAVVGGIYGVLLVGWANIQAGWEYGIYGVALGVAMPVGLVITESILAHALIRSRTQAEQADPEAPTVTQESPNQWEDSQESNHEGELPPITTQETSTEQKESPKNNPVPPIDNEESTREEKETTQEEKNITQAITNESPKDLEETEESPSDTNESPTIETDPEIIYGVAVEMWEQTGDIPTRRGLAEAANTTEHRARKAIDRLKEETAAQEVVAS